MFRCRISRILEAPYGNALLVGVGGSGKQSLCRLAAFLSMLEVFQITLRKGYGINDLKVSMHTRMLNKYKMPLHVICSIVFFWSFLRIISPFSATLIFRVI